MAEHPDTQTTGLEIAIVGMAGTFPGARTVAEFWRNLCAGVESIARFSDEERRAFLSLHAWTRGCVVRIQSGVRPPPPLRGSEA